MQVAGQHGSSLLDLVATGARVSNAYPTFPASGYSLPKGRLIPGAAAFPHGFVAKGVFRCRMGMRSIRQLAG